MLNIEEITTLQLETTGLTPHVDSIIAIYVNNMRIMFKSKSPILNSKYHQITDDMVENLSLFEDNEKIWRFFKQVKEKGNLIFLSCPEFFKEMLDPSGLDLNEFPIISLRAVLSNLKERIQPSEYHQHFNFDPEKLNRGEQLMFMLNHLKEEYKLTNEDLLRLSYYDGINTVIRKNQTVRIDDLNTHSLKWYFENYKEHSVAYSVAKAMLKEDGAKEFLEKSEKGRLYLELIKYDLQNEDILKPLFARTDEIRMERERQLNPAEPEPEAEEYSLNDDPTIDYI
jgi:hypothetical protein